VDAPEVLRVLDALDTAGIRVGITGGWGIDALLRRRIRPHGDVDLGIATDAVDGAVEALRARQWLPAQPGSGA
jgi:lincosamide nucleotidyltransferase A/C/D/E